MLPRGKSPLPIRQNTIIVNHRVTLQPEQDRASAWAAGARPEAPKNFLTPLLLTPFHPPSFRAPPHKWYQFWGEEDRPKGVRLGAAGGSK